MEYDKNTIIASSFVLFFEAVIFFVSGIMTYKVFKVTSNTKKTSVSKTIMSLTTSYAAVRMIGQMCTMLYTMNKSIANLSAMVSFALAGLALYYVIFTFTIFTWLKIIYGFQSKDKKRKIMKLRTAACILCAIWILAFSVIAYGSSYHDRKLANILSIIANMVIGIVPILITFSTIYIGKWLYSVIVNSSWSGSADEKKTRILRKLTTLGVIFVICMDLKMAFYLGKIKDLNDADELDAFKLERYLLHYLPELISIFALIYSFNPFSEKGGSASSSGSGSGSGSVNNNVTATTMSARAVSRGESSANLGQNSDE